MKIAILDFNTGYLIVKNIPTDVNNDSEEIEAWLAADDFQLSNIEWMIIQRLDIEIDLK